RVAAATAWLDAHPRDAEVLVVGPTWEACDDLVRGASGVARFGVVRLTLDRLAVRLATPALACAHRTPATGLSLNAVAARAVHLIRAEGGLAYFTPVADRPGFPLAVARTLAELRMNRVAPDALAALGLLGRDLHVLAARVARELEDAALADRALVFETAVSTPPSHPVGLPLLLLDLPIASACEAALVAMLARHAPDVLATAPTGDVRSAELLEAALDCVATCVEAPPRHASLDALKVHLFELTEPPPTELDPSVTLSSWPGEARECVEIARGVQAEAARGVPFDRMAVFLRSPGEYRPHIQEAFRRAAIPVFFARGTTRPDPAGRALLALLACKAGKLSARRFAEYVSLAQVPDPGPVEDRWVPPENDLLPLPPTEESPTDDDRGDASTRAPWRWERLLVDASVIGGKERWQRRLDGLEQELRLRRKDVEEETRARLLDRQLEDLAYLRGFALPLVDRLDALPATASWREWLTDLRELARAALREPDAVLATLAELEPMGPVGPIDLEEVRLVLGPRLRELTVPPPRRRYGAVFVAPAESARGLAFDVVFVPGLAEKLFPRKIVEDPVLLDAHRRALDAPGLVTQPARVAAERLALRLAVGAARERVLLSWPRVDVEQARPRVPSFYGLQALRSASGRLPSFGELEAGEKAGGRLGWPAPARPDDAIDEAEYDLALLAPLRDADPKTTEGSARYLLDANVHLGRALRARGRRWLRRWTPADGLADRPPALRGVPLSILPPGVDAPPAARGAGRDRGARSADARRALPRGAVRSADGASRRQPATGPPGTSGCGARRGRRRAGERGEGLGREALARDRARLERRHRRHPRRPAGMAPPCRGGRVGAGAFRAVVRSGGPRPTAGGSRERRRSCPRDRRARAARLDRSRRAASARRAARDRSQDRQGAREDERRRRGWAGATADPVRARVRAAPRGAGALRPPLLLYRRRRVRGAGRAARRRKPPGGDRGLGDRRAGPRRRLTARDAGKGRVRLVRLSPGLRPARGDSDGAEAARADQGPRAAAELPVTRLADQA